MTQAAERGTNDAKYIFSDEDIVVFDVGCRFGIHPTWAPLKNASLVKYFAFDPDKEEIDRLRRKYEAFPSYHAFCLGFSNKAETRSLNALSHRGQSSFLKPNTASIWFGRYRRADGEIVSTQSCDLVRMDDFCESHCVWPNFIKIDTEGFDLAVLQGGVKALQSAIGVRCEICFEQTFVGAAKFDEIFRFMTDHGFMLANIDYVGKGVPQSYFCPNPGRWGIIAGGEALFVKELSTVQSLPKYELMKFILFCFLNNLEDLAHKLLVDRRDIRNEPMSALWLEIKRRYLLASKALLFAPGDYYVKVQQDFEEIFGENYPAQHLFFQSDFLNPA